VLERLLIANRGEIAIRVSRTCRTLGVRPFGVYSEADGHALHRRFMEDDVCVGAAPPLESYLNVDAIIAAARRMGCEAIHPGYGFLAENAAFAKRCEDEGIVFVGPPSGAMALTGDKIAARQAMRSAGLTVTRGVDRALDSVDEAQGVAAEIGYPVMIKATGGGGGIGMARVDAPDQLPRAFETARSASLANFGRPDVFLEAYVPRARHIEIQVVIDGAGRGVHFGERECSVQRRHQKLLEESPSPAVTPAARREIGALAVRGLQSVGYRNAGTVEFLYANAAFHFNEVNARLQVEHPVTEVVTGLDLVELQLRVASGEPLDLAQEDIRIRGHAIECRINAEDPARNFAPSPGVIAGYKEPRGPGIRVDSGVAARSEVLSVYDPLIAKLIVRAPDRPTCIARARAAVDAFEIDGVSTTVPFHRVMLRDASFAKGLVWTTIITDRKIPERIRRAGPLREGEWLAIAAFVARAPGGPARFAESPTRPAPPPSPWARRGREENVRRWGHQVPARR